MNASPRELKARYKAAKRVLGLHRKVISMTKRFGTREGSFFNARVGDLQRSYDKSAAWLEAWRKKHGVEDSVARSANAKSPRKKKSGRRGVITLIRGAKRGSRA